MAYKITIDQNNIVTQIYNLNSIDIQVPPEAIEITDAQAEAMIDYGLLAFTYIGGVISLDQALLAQQYADAAKTDKIIQLKAEGLARINAIFPGIEDYNAIAPIGELWKSIDPAARQQPTADLQKAIDIYTAGKQAKADIEALTTQAEIEAYDVTTDPAWP